MHSTHTHTLYTHVYTHTQIGATDSVQCLLCWKQNLSVPPEVTITSHITHTHTHIHTHTHRVLAEWLMFDGEDNAAKYCATLGTHAHTHTHSRNIK